MHLKPINTWPCASDKKLNILISTGEVSGDMIGANLAGALKAANPETKISGVGGGLMLSAGVNVFFNTACLGSVGFSDVLATGPGMLKTFSRIRDHIRAQAPKVAVLVGHEVFHILLGRWLKANNILTIAYFPPQVWLWRSLLRPIAKSFDWILTSFVQEHEIYHGAGARTVFVGHYLRDQLREICPERRQAIRRQMGFKADCAVVGLLPGSRIHEVERHTQILLAAAAKMLARDLSIQFVLPVADPFFRERIKRAVEASGLRGSVATEYDSRRAMEASDVVIVCSGTATLEAALIGIPMVIIYRTSRTTWLNVKLLEDFGLIASRTCGLPNLLAGSRIVPELHQSEVTPSIVADQAWSILRDPLRQAQLKADLRNVSSQLGEKGAMERAARTILQKSAEISSDR
jgi:lipid-A-disaccharide synthase